MKPEDIRKMNQKAFHKAYIDALQERFKLRFQHKGGQLENTSLIRKNRRIIARMETLKTQHNA